MLTTAHYSLGSENITKLCAQYFNFRDNLIQCLFNRIIGASPLLGLVRSSARVPVQIYNNSCIFTWGEGLKSNQKVVGYLHKVSVTIASTWVS